MYLFEQSWSVGLRSRNSVYNMCLNRVRDAYLKLELGLSFSVSILGLPRPCCSDHIWFLETSYPCGGPCFNFIGLYNKT